MEDIFALVDWTTISAFVAAGVTGVVGIDLLFLGGKYVKRLFRRS